MARDPHTGTLWALGHGHWGAKLSRLPQRSVYDVVYRHALGIRGAPLAFGSTTGNLYVSEDHGDSWHEVAHHLPPIYSVRFG